MFLVRELVLCSCPAVVGEHLTEGLLVPIFRGQAGSHHVVAACHTLHYLYMMSGREKGGQCVCNRVKPRYYIGI